MDIGRSSEEFSSTFDQNYVAVGISDLDSLITMMKDPERRIVLFTAVDPEILIASITICALDITVDEFTSNMAHYLNAGQEYMNLSGDNQRRIGFYKRATINVEDAVKSYTQAAGHAPQYIIYFDPELEDTVKTATGKTLKEASITRH